MNLVFTSTDLPEVIYIRSDKFRDDRGWLSESYNKEVFHSNGITEEFIQEKHSYSKYGVIRGLHFQYNPYGQGKLVRCSFGTVYDVVVDIRPSSSNFRKSIGVELSVENGNMLYIPPGFAHGFSVISQTGASFTYMTTKPFNKEYDGGVNIFDETIGIDWKILPKHHIISDKDKNMPTLNDILYKL